MLTPQEITDKVFVKAVFGGYDMTGVDDFLESLSADYAALYKENAILKGKLKVLVEKVEEYRSTEDAMRMALLTAQKMGEEITIEANKQKEETLKSVNIEAKTKLTEIKRLIADEQAKLNIASKETAKFIRLSQAVMQKHSEFLKKLETAKRAAVPDVVAPPPTQEEQVASVASEIESSVGKIVGNSNESDEQPVSSEPEAVYEQETIHDDTAAEDVEFDANGVMLYNEDEPSSTPRPKFDFDDLKFGANFDKD